MVYRILVSIAVVAILGIASVSSEALARGGPRTASNFHGDGFHGGVHRGGVYAGRSRGRGAAAGAAAVGVEPVGAAQTFSYRRD